MINDITYQEINIIKTNVEEFISTVQELSLKLNFKFCQADQDFFIFVAKHIIFFKYLYSGKKNAYFYKVLISDLYYLILSILENKRRYMYLNERSVIENYMRSIMCISVKDNHITENIFKEMRNKTFKCVFNNDEYSLIKSEYSMSCNYIHGGNFLNKDLAFVLKQCASNEFNIEDRKKYYIRFQKILQIFDKLILSEDTEYISGCFHRKKSIMKYLLGQKYVDLLFEFLG